MPEPEFAYFNGDFRPLEDAKVSVRAKALNYGLGVFEGIRGYWNEGQEQLLLFRLREHYVRLSRSCRICRLPLKHSIEEMMELTCELCRRNGHREDVYVRPLYYVSSELLSPTLPTDPEDTEFTLWTLPLAHYLEAEGVRAIVTSWRRVADNMIPARAKPTAAYLNSALARAEARDAGAEEAIFLTNDGYVSEGSAEHLFLFIDGELVTPTCQDDNLDGITRRTILELAEKELGLPARVRRVSRTELYIAQEAFFVGTGAQVVPIIEIDHRHVGSGRAGPITAHVRDAYNGIVRGDTPGYDHWRHPVYV